MLEKSEADFVFVLFTSDDMVRDAYGNEYSQPRPNALIELGHFMAKLGRDNIALLCQEEVFEPIASDIKGIRVGKFASNVLEESHFILNELAGFGLGPWADCKK